MGERLHHNPLLCALFTDLYELTMAQAYRREGMSARASFELFFRSLPGERRYIVAAGLEDVLASVERFTFTDDDLAYLSGHAEFDEAFLESLRDLRFTGDIHAVPEGTVVFPNEPLIRVEAPIIEAQLLETLALNQIHAHSVAASKAARVVLAAQGRSVVDFGSRRAHGADAAMNVARATYLVGGAGTSNVLAGKRFGMPIFGTMAHSYIQAHDDEQRAFEVYAEMYPGTTLLVDTYDTLRGVQLVIELAHRMGDRFNVRAIRLDSGDLEELAKRSRAMLDEAGLTDMKIFASSGLDESEIERLLRVGAPIDGFGVGTKLAVSPDAPSLDLAYKLVEYDGSPRMKLSADKVILPGRKQVFRQYENGRMAGDVIAAAEESGPGEPLLAPVMLGGVRTDAGRDTLEDARRRAMSELEALPEALRRISGPKMEYTVRASDRLKRAAEDVRRAQRADTTPTLGG